jgi:hypothetical protein
MFDSLHPSTNKKQNFGNLAIGQRIIALHRPTTVPPRVKVVIVTKESRGLKDLQSLILPLKSPTLLRLRICHMPSYTGYIRSPGLVILDSALRHYGLSPSPRTLQRWGGGACRAVENNPAARIFDRVCGQALLGGKVSAESNFFGKLASEGPRA